MPWALIITLFVQLFGPLIAEWFKRRLEGRLQDAAAELGHQPVGADPRTCIDALYTRALAMTPLVCIGERRMLKIARRAALDRAHQAEPAALTAAEMEGTLVAVKEAFTPRPSEASR